MLPVAHAANDLAVLKPLSIGDWPADADYRPYRFVGNDLPSFNVFISEPRTPATGPLVLYLKGSDCNSNFRRHDGAIQPGWFDVIRRRAGPTALFVVPEPVGVVPLAQTPPGSATAACTAEFQANANFGKAADGVSQLVRALLNERRSALTQVLIIGASDGATLAALVAGRVRQVSHVALLVGGGDNQLVEFMHLAARGSGVYATDARPENDRIRSLLGAFAQVRAGWMTDDFMGHPPGRWASSFTLSVGQALRAGAARIYLISGTRDDSAPVEAFDALAIDLVRAGADVTVERIVGADHSLRDSDPPNRSHLPDVTDRIFNWLIEGRAPQSTHLVWPPA